MNPTEFKTTRDANLAKFETEYAALKTEYSTALQLAKDETDRQKQCVLIKNALDANKKLSTLVSDFLRLNDEGGCSLSPDKIQALRNSIEKYKTQAAEIQQGRDRLHALETAFADIDSKAIQMEGTNMFYFILIGLGMVTLVILIIGSGISSIFNAQTVAPVVPGSFA